jgi:hypothetical protein
VARRDEAVNTPAPRGPHNVTVLLLTALIILAYKNIDAISVEPRYINTYALRS